jgi:heme/copper-type cytochrome/quinol oxidase subunit 1
MHFLGIAGMPRRIPDYPDCYIGWNQIATVGSNLSAFGLIIFFTAIYLAFFNEADVREEGGRTA